MVTRDKIFSINFKIDNLEDSFKTIVKSIYNKVLYIYDDTTAEIVKNYKPEFKVHISDNLDVIANYQTIIFLLDNNNEHLETIQILANKYIGKMFVIDNVYSTGTTKELLDIVHSVIDYSLSEDDHILTNITSSFADNIVELFDKVKGTPYFDRVVDYCA